MLQAKARLEYERDRALKASEALVALERGEEPEQRLGSLDKSLESLELDHDLERSHCHDKKIL